MRVTTILKSKPHKYAGRRWFKSYQVIGSLLSAAALIGTAVPLVAVGIAGTMPSLFENLSIAIMGLLFGIIGMTGMAYLEKQLVKQLDEDMNGAS